jgi:hypothetical protein
MTADLYIASRSDRSDIVKIGRSGNVKRHCSALSASQCFKVRPTHVYPNCGGFEKAVHDALARYRVEGGSGREWFNISATAARRIVDDILPGKRRTEEPNPLAFDGYLEMLREIGISPWEVAR